MPFCQVIKSNDRPCAAYARKGLTCCYAHRKLENTKVVAPNPCDPKYSPTEPAEPVKPVNLDEYKMYEIDETFDDDMWYELAYAAYQGPAHFLRILIVLRAGLGFGIETKKFGFILIGFNKDTQKKIESLKSDYFFVDRDSLGQLVVYIPK